MWFLDFVTVFIQSYNCQTSHYLGRNRLPKPLLLLLSLGLMVKSDVPKLNICQILMRWKLGICPQILLDNTVPLQIRRGRLRWLHKLVPTCFENVLTGLFSCWGEKHMLRYLWGHETTTMLWREKKSHLFQIDFLLVSEWRCVVVLCVLYTVAIASYCCWVRVAFCDLSSTIKVSLFEHMCQPLEAKEPYYTLPTARDDTTSKLPRASQCFKSTQKASFDATLRAKRL